MTEERVDVVVVGAGFAGLSAARKDAVGLDADDVVGGRSADAIVLVSWKSG